MTYEFKIILFSNQESIVGLTIDKGEFEGKNQNWVPYIRIRIGLIFIIFQLMRF